jgi:hypothetical protein
MGDDEKRSAMVELVRRFREPLRYNGIQPMSDCGSSGRRLKSCQPDQRTRTSAWRLAAAGWNRIPLWGMYATNTSPPKPLTRYPPSRRCAGAAAAGALHNADAATNKTTVRAFNLVRCS